MFSHPTTKPFTWALFLTGVLGALLSGCVGSPVANSAEERSTPDANHQTVERWVFVRVDSTQAAVAHLLEADSSAHAWLIGQRAIARAMMHAHHPGFDAHVAGMRTAGERASNWSAALQAMAMVNSRDPDQLATAGHLLDSLGALADGDTVLIRDILLTRLRIHAQRQEPGKADSLLDANMGWVASDSLVLSEATSIRGTAHLDSGNPAYAALLFERADQFGASSGPTRASGMNWLNLGYARTELGDYAETARCAKRADSLFILIGDHRDRISALDMLGYAYWGVLAPGTEVALWKKAVELADSLGEEQKGALAHMNLARFYVGCDTACALAIGAEPGTGAGTAMTHARIAQRVAVEQRNEVLYGQSLKIETGILNRKGEFAKAIDVGREALPLFERANNHQWICAMLIDIASNQLSLKDWRSAEASLERALGMATLHGFGNLRMLALYRLQHVMKQQGRYAEALATLERYHAVQDSIQGIAVTDKLAQLDLRHKFEQRVVEDSLEHVAALKMEKQRAMDERKAERGRSRTFLIGGVLTFVGLLAITLTERKRRRERFAKEAAQLEARALRAQMDPHFIGNTLHAVNSYLLSNDPATASTMLSRFAKWIRSTLESSRHEEIPLRDDIEAMRTYLALEQARTRAKFNYRIDVPEDDELLRTRIPPMLVQPFLENAIQHGVLPKEGIGHIVLHIVDKSDHLLIAVEDDGIGRHCAKEQVHSSQKTSLSTTITRERLQLLGERTGRPGAVRVIDLEQGTRVELEVPVA